MGSGWAMRSHPVARLATTTRRWALPLAAPGNPSNVTLPNSVTTCQSEEFTAVGIGDMSGDVFGNGLMRSEKTRLVAAFDHRDIFLDPNPNPAVSFEERVRLYKLPRSSWQDYNRD